MDKQNFLQHQDTSCHVVGMFQRKYSATTLIYFWVSLNLFEHKSRSQMLVYYRLHHIVKLLLLVELLKIKMKLILLNHKVIGACIFIQKSINDVTVVTQSCTYTVDYLAKGGAR